MDPVVVVVVDVVAVLGVGAVLVDLIHAEIQDVEIVVAVVDFVTPVDVVHLFSDDPASLVLKDVV